MPFEHLNTLSDEGHNLLLTIVANLVCLHEVDDQARRLGKILAVLFIAARLLIKSLRDELLRRSLNISRRQSFLILFLFLYHWASDEKMA